MRREARIDRMAALGLAAVLFIALLARLQPWAHVFPADAPGAIFVGDSDAYYHALRAERIAAHFPTIPWTDPGMNYPDGADILWPPLFDTGVAAMLVPPDDWRR